MKESRKVYGWLACGVIVAARRLLLVAAPLLCHSYYVRGALPIVNYLGIK